MKKKWEDNFDDDSFEVLGSVDSFRNRKARPTGGRIHLSRERMYERLGELLSDENCSEVPVDDDINDNYNGNIDEDYNDDIDYNFIEDDECKRCACSVSAEYEAPPRPRMSSFNRDLMVVSIKRRRRYRISLLRIFTFILIIAIIIYLICLIFKSEDKPAAYRMEDTSITSVRQADVDNSVVAVENVADDVADSHLDALPVIHDSMNDVEFRLYPVETLLASVEFAMPSVDDDFAIVTAAADYRADNGKIVGEFIKDGKTMSSGDTKAGWCYVSKDGAITIGAGSGDDIKNVALDKGGCFFRQYPLVMDGEVVPNPLKGKSLRRALGFYEGEPYIIRSDEKESIFDFSQALADYGFSHVIYLPGGEGKWMSHTGDGTEIHNEYLPENSDATYLIFKNR